MTRSALDARSFRAALAFLAVVALSAPPAALAIPGLDTAGPKTASPKPKIKDPPQITAAPETGAATADVATTPDPSTAAPTATPSATAVTSVTASSTPPATATSTPPSSLPATAALLTATPTVAKSETGWSWLWWLLGGLMLVFVAGRTALTPVDRWPRGVAIAVGLAFGLAAGVAVPLFGPLSAIVILVAAAATALRVALSGRPSAPVTARRPPPAQANAAPVAQTSLPSEPL